jgi:hypothetical protein
MKNLKIKLTVCLFVFYCIIFKSAFAQNTPIPIFEIDENQTFTEVSDYMNQHILYNYTIPYAILYNRVMPFAQLHHFNKDNPDTSSYWHFIQAYSELQRSCLTANKHLPLTVEELKKLDNESVVKIGIINFNFKSLT